MLVLYLKSWLLNIYKPTTDPKRWQSKKREERIWVARRTQAAFWQSWCVHLWGRTKLLHLHHSILEYFLQNFGLRLKIIRIERSRLKIQGIIDQRIKCANADFFQAHMVKTRPCFSFISIPWGVSSLSVSNLIYEKSPLSLIPSTHLYIWVVDIFSWNVPSRTFTFHFSTYTLLSFILFPRRCC